MSNGRGGRYGLMGPAILITIGTIFLVQRFNPDYSIARLWPVILIVIGVVKLLEAAGVGRGSSEPGPPAGGAAPGSAGTSGTSSQSGGSAGSRST